MKIGSKVLGVIVLVLVFGGIMGASALGLWQTRGGGGPGKIQAAVGNAEYTPGEIRGSAGLVEVSAVFGIPLETLGRSFGLGPDVNLQTFRNKDLESFYSGLGEGVEIGNGSMKWFVALYTDQPYPLDLDGEEVYLLEPAVDILKARGNLTQEQIAYLDAHTIGLETVNLTLPPQQDVESHGGAEGGTSITGQTYFGDLLDWGMSVEQIEAIIGGKMPNRLTRVRDYCADNGIPFGQIKSVLQAEVDRLNQ